jgi:CRISPR-associated protein Csx10
VSLPLTLHLDGPLAVAARTVGNVVESLDFVPGTYLLPHVTGVLGAAGINVRAAIARGDVCVLPATIEVGGERGRPVPFAFFAPKGGEGFKPATLINRLLDREPDDAQVKQLRAGYLGPGDDPSVPRHVTVPVTVQTHNVVEDRRQRPTTDVGGVYAFEAINPRETDGTAVVLRTELRLREDLAEQLRDRWWERLAGNVRLGSSKKDDYGAAKLVVAGAPRPLPDWDRGQGGSPLFVWLLSDTLLRGDDLRPDPSAEALARVLSAALGVELKRRPAGPDGRLTGCARVRRTE